MSSVELPDGDVITTDADGIQVTKDAFWFNDSVVQIEFAITSDEEEPRQVSIRDEIPGEEGPDEVEFHPKYDPYNWSRTPDGGVEYENEVAPGERVVTAYGFTTPGLSDLSWVQQAPEVRCEHPDDRSGPVLEEEPTSDTKGLGATEGDGGSETISQEQPDDASSQPAELGGGEPEWMQTDGSADVTPPYLEDLPEGEFTRSSSGSVEGDDVEDRGEAGESTESDLDVEDSANGTGDSLVKALIQEIQGGDLEPEDTEALRSALLDPRGPGDGRFRFEDLQANVKNLELFLQSLDDFLEEDGDGQAILDDLREDLDQAHRERRELRSEVEALRERFEGFEGLGNRLDDLEASVSDLGEDISALTSTHSRDLERVDDRMDGLEAEVEEHVHSVEGELEALRRTLERVTEWREQMLSAISYDPAVETDGDAEGRIFD